MLECRRKAPKCPHIYYSATSSSLFQGGDLVKDGYLKWCKSEREVLYTCAKFLIPCWDLRNNNIQVSNSRRCRLQIQEKRHINLRSKKLKYVSHSEELQIAGNWKEIFRVLKDHLFFGHCSFYVQNGGAWNNPNSTIPIQAEWWKDSQHTRWLGHWKLAIPETSFIDPHDLSRRQQGPRYSLGDFKPPSTCFSCSNMST